MHSVDCEQRAEACDWVAGVGFAKTGKGNLEVMCGLQRIRSQLKGALQGMPLLLGPSRKGFLGKITGKQASSKSTTSGLANRFLSVIGTTCAQYAAHLCPVYTLAEGLSCSRLPGKLTGDQPGNNSTGIHCKLCSPLLSCLLSTCGSVKA